MSLAGGNILVVVVGGLGGGGLIKGRGQCPIPEGSSLSLEPEPHTLRQLFGYLKLPSSHH